MFLSVAALVMSSCGTHDTQALYQLETQEEYEVYSAVLDRLIYPYYDWIVVESETSVSPLEREELEIVLSRVAFELPETGDNGLLDSFRLQNKKQMALAYMFRKIRDLALISQEQARHYMRSNEGWDSLY